MKLRRLFPCALFALLTAASLWGQARILGLEPTVLFPTAKPLRQLARADFENTTKQPLAVTLETLVDGKAEGKAQTLTLSPGASRVDVLVPDIAKESALEVRVLVEGKAVDTLTKVWQPQRKWKVYVVKSSHEDLGYESFLFEKQSDIADYVDFGARLSGAKDSPPNAAKPKGANFHYYLESLIFGRNYMDERSEAQWRTIVNEQLKTGRMGMSGSPTAGVHAHWMDTEELIRQNYPAQREYADRFGMDFNLYLDVDNPSVSWAQAQMLAQSKFPYVVRFGQPWRTGGNNDYATTKVPAIFWWKGPDGQSKVLFAWRSHYGTNFWFGQTNGGFADLSDLGGANVDRELKRVQDGGLLGPYPYDALLIPSYEDHELLAWGNRGLRAWQKAYRYPEIRIADPKDFMSYMEETYAKQIPELSGDLNNFSADYATIDPTSQAWKRRAARLLPFAESLASVLCATDATYVPPTLEVTRAFDHLIDYNEHSWPTSPATKSFHRFNAQWGKQMEAARALGDAEAILDGVLTPLSAKIPTQAGTQTVVIFNPLAHARTDIARFPGAAPALTDGAAIVPAAPDADGRSVFVANDVPAFGYKTFRVAEAPVAKPGVSVSGYVIENQFYKLTLEKKTGVVKSWFDKTLNRELLDAAAPYAFNQLILVSTSKGDSPELDRYAPDKTVKYERAANAVYAEITSLYKDKKLGDAEVRQTIRLYDGLRRVDVRNEIRHAGILFGDKKERYRQNLYFAFPFAVDKFTARAEGAVGVVRPYDDQLRWGSHDYLSANRWVDVSNADFGVTLAIKNAPVVSFGDIRYNAFSIDYKPTKSHLYSYAWSNRMAGLLELGADELNAVFEYAFTTHAGDWQNGAPAFGWSVASPLLGRALPEGQKGALSAQGASFLSISAPNVQLVTLKHSEQVGRGWILRVMETEGKATTATVDVGTFPVNRATATDLVENDRDALALKDGKLTVQLPPFGLLSVRLTSDQNMPGKVLDVAAEAVSDSVVNLRWKGADGAATYAVFASLDPDAPATLYTEVARVGGTQFAHKGLDIGRTYTYRVAAVNAANMRGDFSEKIAATTLTKNTTPPAPVKELSVVRDADGAFMISWLKSPESDVARYHVVRAQKEDFSDAKEAGVFEPTRFYVQMFEDKGLAPATTYHYRVYPEDWAANRQSESPTASAQTPTAFAKSPTPSTTTQKTDLED